MRRHPGNLRIVVIKLDCMSALKKIACDLIAPSLSARMLTPKV